MGITNRTAIALVFAVASGSLALAQTATTNPLRPAASKKTEASPVAAPTTTPAAEPAAKPKRPRSPAQLANDNRMRACGKEWRENKPKLTAQGKTWRVYNVECRARMKAAGQ
jgi:hypothetical protein